MTLAVRLSAPPAALLQPSFLNTPPSNCPHNPVSGKSSSPATAHTDLKHPIFSKPITAARLIKTLHQGDWIKSFQSVTHLATRTEAAKVLKYLADQKLDSTVQGAHFVRRLFSVMPYDTIMETLLPGRQFSKIRSVGRASQDISLWKLSAKPRAVLEALPHLSVERGHQLLEWVYERGRLAEFELILEEEFLVHDTTHFEGTHEEWNALEARLLDYYQPPATTPLHEKKNFVARYIGIPLDHEKPPATAARLSLFSKNPHIARRIWDKAQKEPSYLDYLFQLGQLSTFLGIEGKTIYRESTPLCTFTELIQTHQGVCETFSFLFSSLAPVIGLKVYTGSYPNHIFIHTAVGDVVIETTADFNLRPASKYFKEAAYDDEFRQPTPAYWLIRWRLINMVFMHMIHNKGTWDPHLLTIGHKLFPQDPFFSSSSFLTQLALAFFSQGETQRAIALCKRIGPHAIKHDVLILIYNHYNSRGLHKQAQDIIDFSEAIRKI